MNIANMGVKCCWPAICLWKKRKRKNVRNNKHCRFSSEREHNIIARVLPFLFYCSKKGDDKITRKLLCVQ